MSRDRQQQQQQHPPRRTMRQSLRLALLVLLLGLLAAFAVGNSEIVRVWPFRQNVPLFAVVIGCFVLGALAGWLGRGVAVGRHRNPADPAPGPPAQT